MAEWKMKKTKKAWSVEGFPVPNRVLTEFTMEIKPALPQQGITKGYAAQLQEKKSALYIQGVCTVALLAPWGDLCFPCCCVRSSPHVRLGIQYVGKLHGTGPVMANKPPQKHKHSLFQCNLFFRMIVCS